MDAVTAAVLDILKGCGIGLCGTADFALLQAHLRPCAGRRMLPEDARSAVMALFPYYAGEAGGNLSKYAAARDYHLTVMEMLREAAARLKETFPQNAFVPFCDDSPIPEVGAALLAGLGLRGRNGLLISEAFGSYVFIGEVITDLALEAKPAAERGCLGCGECEKCCPSGALRGEGLLRRRCLSDVTQRRGELTQREQTLIRGTGRIWGCDICQDVCPHNRTAQETPIAAFRRDLKPSLCRAEIDDTDFEEKNADRAFLWKGKTILRRNLGILEGHPEDTIR